jgi:hypothetical protein
MIMFARKRHAISVPEFLGWFLIGVASAGAAILVFTAVVEVLHR